MFIQDLSKICLFSLNIAFKHCLQTKHFLYHFEWNHKLLFSWLTLLPLLVISFVLLKEGFPISLAISIKSTIPLINATKWKCTLGSSRFFTISSLNEFEFIRLFDLFLNIFLFVVCSPCLELELFSLGTMTRSCFNFMYFLT